MASIWRQLMRRPTEALVAVVTIAVGIAACTTIFTLVYHVLLRPLPFHEPERLVFVRQASADGSVPFSVTLPDYSEWRQEIRTLSAVSGFRADSFSLRHRGNPERVRGAMVSHDFFGTLGVEPMRGRAFEASRGSASNNGNDTFPLVLSYGLWQRLFSGNEAAIGTAVQLDGRPFTVVAVMPAEFEFLSRRIEFWVRIEDFPDLPWEDRGSHPGLWVVGRLADGASLEATKQELTAHNERVRRGTDYEATVQVMSLHERVVARSRELLLLVAGSSLLLLLIACSNVASLQLARALDREKEMATRHALGASWRQIFVQLVKEGLILSAMGGALGMLASVWAVDLALQLNPNLAPRMLEVRIDLAVAAFAAVVSMVCGVFFGLAPALHARAPKLRPVLSGHSTQSPRANRSRRAMIIAELALASLLLMVSAVTVHALRKLANTDPGFASSNRIAVRFSLAPNRYPTTAAGVAFCESILEATLALPGIDSASIANSLPLVDPGGEAMVRATLPDEDDTIASIQVVTPDHFRTMATPLIAGRGLLPSDRAESTRVAVIDTLLARRLFPGGNALGSRISFEGDANGPIEREIVGISAHVLNYRLDAPEYGEIYVPLQQPPSWYVGALPTMTLAVHSARPPAELFAEIREVARRMDPEQPLFGATTFTTVLDDAMGSARWRGLVVSLFAMCALLLAAVGVHGVVATLVYQRRREFGVRMAFGASTGRLTRETILGTLGLAGRGLGFGLIAAAIALRAGGNLVGGLQASDAIAVLPVLPAVLMVTLLAAYLPARRIQRVSPNEVLRPT